jgi:hypothetical protein
MRAFLLALFASATVYAGQATVTWTAPSTCSDGTSSSACPATGYRIYSGTCGQSKTVVTASPAATLTTTILTGLAPGKWCFDMTTVAAGGESVHTNEVSTVIPSPLPSPPGNVTAAVLVADNGAYKMRQAVDGFQFVKIGTLPVGTSCETSHEVDGYSIVARSNVSLTSRFDTLPLVVFAKCG